MAFQKSLVFFICQCITTIVAVDALSFVSYTTYINSNSEKDVQCIQFDFRKISFISLELSDQSLHSLPRLCSPSTPDGEYRSGLWLHIHLVCVVLKILTRDTAALRPNSDLLYIGECSSLNAHQRNCDTLHDMQSNIYCWVIGLCVWGRVGVRGGSGDLMGDTFW